MGAGGQVIGTHNQSAWTQELIPHPQAATPLAKYQDGGTYFVHPNLLRSSTMLTDHSGSGTQELAFHAWGEQWFTGGTVKDNRFASMRFRDEETTLDPTPYRNYSPRLGRWLSPDPSCCCGAGNPQDLNRYTYGANSPANRIDPAGLQAQNPYWPWPTPWPYTPSPCGQLSYAISHAECRIDPRRTLCENPLTAIAAGCVGLPLAGGPISIIIYLRTCYLEKVSLQPIKLPVIGRACAMSGHCDDGSWVVGFYTVAQMKPICGPTVEYECPVKMTTQSFGFRLFPMPMPVQFSIPRIIACTPF